MDRLRAFADAQTGVLPPRAIDDPDLREWWAGRGLQEGVLVALKGENRVVGLLVLAERVGVERSFNSDELRLVETLAGNVSVALQFDHLEHAVRELTSLRADLEREAFYDSLTGLANRSLFINRVDKALRTRANSLFVLFIDIDDFKTINDTLGHQSGDEVLAEVAKRLRAACATATPPRAWAATSSRCCSRTSPAPADAIAVAERTLGEFRNPIHVAGERVPIQLSIGVAKGPGPDTAGRAAAQRRRRHVRRQGPRQEPAPALRARHAARDRAAPPAQARARVGDRAPRVLAALPADH